MDGGGACTQSSKLNVANVASLDAAYQVVGMFSSIARPFFCTFGNGVSLNLQRNHRTGSARNISTLPVTQCPRILQCTY